MSSKKSFPEKIVENWICFSTYTQYGFHNILHAGLRVYNLSTVSPA